MNDRTSVVIHSDLRRPPLTRVIVNGHEIYVSAWSIDQSKITEPGTVTLTLIPDHVEVIPVPRPEPRAAG